MTVGETRGVDVTDRSSVVVAPGDEGVPVPALADFEHPLRVRYMEVDAQGVVFNAWYLTYCDEALAAFLTHRGLPYASLLGAGYDTQLVRAEIDFRAGLRWEDDFVVAVSTARIGRTSFTVTNQLRRGDKIVCEARITHVVVGTDGTGKRPVPDLLLDALGVATELEPQ